MPELKGNRGDCTVTDPLQATDEELRRRVTELEELNGLLVRDSQRKSDFLASMSHEIRTPLNAINGFTELLADKTYGPLSETQERFTARILEAGQHLLQLLNDVIDISKIEVDKVELESRPVSAHRAIEQAVMVSRGMARERRVSLDIADAGQDIMVWADERRLKQVLFNLLSNAIKYSPEGSKVIAKVEVGDDARIEITDQGVGIAPEDQERVFEEFERVDNGGQNPDGAGLGLALSRRLVRMHGGEMGLESSPGKGSIFWFTLPLAVPPETANADEPGGRRLAPSC